MNHAVAIHFDEQPRAYTGHELRSHFAYREFAILGDSAVGFVGPCRVEVDALVDLEDVRRQAGIVSPRMVHLLIEHFQTPLVEAVLRQRLLVHLVADQLRAEGVASLEVQGDDLFVDGRKASVSIATLSPVSALIHFGLNVETEGTPLPTWGLGEAALEPGAFTRNILSRYGAACADLDRATSKVRGVS